MKDKKVIQRKEVTLLDVKHEKTNHTEERFGIEKGLLMMVLDAGLITNDEYNRAIEVLCSIA